MFDDPVGPIEHFSWARFVIRGQEHAQTEGSRVGAGKDIRMVGDEVSPWQERHGHTLTPAMISGVYGHGIDVLIIGIGVQGLIECPEEVQSAIRTSGIGELILARTPDACRCYNALYHAGRKVALLAHGTC